jgi:hypothetical protein
VQRDVDEPARVEDLFEVVDQPLVCIGCGIRDVLDCCAVETGLGREFATGREVYLLALDDLLDFFAVNVGYLAEGGEGGVYGGCLVEPQRKGLLAADRGHLDDFGSGGWEEEGEEDD